MDKNLLNELVTSMNRAVGATADNKDMAPGEFELVDSFHRKLASAYLDHDGNLPYNGFEVGEYISEAAKAGDEVAESLVDAMESDEAIFTAASITTVEAVMQECTRVWMVALDIKDVTHKVH